MGHAMCGVIVIRSRRTWPLRGGCTRSCDLRKLQSEGSCRRADADAEVREQWEILHQGFHVCEIAYGMGPRKGEGLDMRAVLYAGQM